MLTLHIYTHLLLPMQKCVNLNCKFNRRATRINNYKMINKFAIQKKNIQYIGQQTKIISMDCNFWHAWQVPSASDVQFESRPRSRCRHHFECVSMNTTLLTACARLISDFFFIYSIVI